MTILVMWTIVMVLLSLLWMVGNAFPRSPSTTPRPMGVPNTDLRISEFAPDLNLAYQENSAYRWRQDNPPNNLTKSDRELPTYYA